MKANFCGKCGNTLDERGLCPNCNPKPLVQDITKTPVVSGKFCGKCGSTLNAQGVCPVCTAEREIEQESLVQPTPKKKNKKKLIIIIVALVLVVALALTTIFVVLPMFNKKEDNKFYSSGKDGVAFKTESYGTFYTTGSGLCSVDKNGEVSILHYYDTEYGKKMPIHYENIVCIGDSIYMQEHGDIYKIDIMGENVCKSDLWLSIDDVENMDLDLYGYDHLTNTYFYTWGSNFQYHDGYIYYSRETDVTEYERGQPMSSKEMERVNVIGRINIETKTPEIVKLVTEHSYEFDYVVYDEWVFYTVNTYEDDVNSKIYRMSLGGKDERLVYEAEGVISDLGVYNDKLYFTTLRDGGEISEVDMDGSKQRVLISTESYIAAYTLNPESNTMYYIADSDVYKLSMDTLESKKILGEASHGRYLTCVDGKLYGLMLNYITRDGYITEDTNFEDLNCGSREKPLISAAFYDTKSKTASVVYTYNELDRSEFSKKSAKEIYSYQKYFVKEYQGETYLSQRMNNREYGITLYE